MELFDLYDADRVRTGKTVVRGEPIPEGYYHLVVHICIFNSAGQMLIQRRQPFKQGWPDLWDVTVGGSAVAGDTSRSAAERETREELGLAIDLTGDRPSMTIDFDRGYDDYYILTRDVGLSSLTLQPEEVQAVRWATKEEILSMIDDGSFIPYEKSLINLLFFLKDRRSAHTVR